MFSHQLSMYVVDLFYTINRFIVYHKVINFPITCCHLSLKFPIHNFSLTKFSVFHLNLNSGLPLTNK